MLRANALIIVILIALTIGIFSSSLILIAYHSRLHTHKNLLLNKLELNLQSGVNLLLSGYDSLPYNETLYVDLFEKEEDSLLIKKLPWGLFEVAVINSFSNKSSVSKTILYGYKPDSISSSAIYVLDEKRQLNIGGETKIRGTAYVSEYGVQKDFSHGHYKGDTLIYGRIKKSNDTLPALNKGMVKYLEEFFADSTFLQKGFEIKTELHSDSINISFMENTIVELHTSECRLEGKKYTGNIIIYSAVSVTIPSNTRLDNIMIFAPLIKVESGFEGNAQLFATDSIIIGKRCRLNYPSGLGLFKNSFKIGTPTIVIEEGAVVSGIVFTHQSVKDMNETMISIKKNSRIEGQIYGDGYVELKGKVLGNVICKRFRMITPGGVYDNLLLNASIDNTKMHKYFVGSGLSKSKNEKGIIKWLD